MTAAEVITLLVLTLCFGMSVGGIIALTWSKKIVDEMDSSYKRTIQSFGKICDLDREIISKQRKIVQDTYSYLVNLRDHDAGSLDEIIGTLGEMLDDHKEEEE